MELGAQRGSVADMPLFAGDPLTPGIAATKDAKRLDRKDAPTLTKIPVLPISYADARPLLQALGGHVVPEAWRGALPITYHFGPGPAKVHLRLEFDWKLVPAMDVIAVMKGSTYPDEWVLRGNHHDAWVNGADDPVSGAVVLMEEARAVAELAKAGARPKRTVVYALWDGEEQGLLGSTEWVEAHADELRSKAVAYVNSDSNSRGFLQAGGSHTLEPFVDEIARDVVDPQTKVSVHERARAYLELHGPADAAKDVRERGALRLSALGSGSDFTPFLQHMGVASLNIGFGGEAEGGSYHSIFDSIDHFTRFGDPTFEYGIALAKVGGRTVLRLANADLLPFDASALAETVASYAREVQKLADDLRDEDGGGEPEDPGAGVRARGRPHPRAGGAPARRTPFPTSASHPSRTRWRGFRAAPLPSRRRAPSKACPRGAKRAQRGLHRPGAQAHPPRGPARAALVHPPGLCPGLLHGLRGEDAARHPRGPGAAAVGPGHPADRERGPDPGRLLGRAGAARHSVGAAGRAPPRILRLGPTRRGEASRGRARSEGNRPVSRFTNREK